MSKFKIFYMNQGTRGHWGAIKYSLYDVILLAESKVVKPGFKIQYESTDSIPVMSMQTRSKERRRMVSSIKDIDLLKKTVRPIVTCQLLASVNKKRVRLIFVHLKSAHKGQADSALLTAAAHLRSSGVSPEDPILWVGDFNRAGTPPDLGDYSRSRDMLFLGGGMARWFLDRVYITGDWTGHRPKVTQVTKSGSDHDHAGISIEFESD